MAVRVRQDRPVPPEEWRAYRRLGQGFRTGCTQTCVASRALSFAVDPRPRWLLNAPRNGQGPQLLAELGRGHREPRLDLGVHRLPGRLEVKLGKFWLLHSTRPQGAGRTTTLSRRASMRRPSAASTSLVTR